MCIRMGNERFRDLDRVLCRRLVGPNHDDFVMICRHLFVCILANVNGSIEEAVGLAEAAIYSTLKRYLVRGSTW